jgi:hypothetical protein
MRHNVTHFPFLLLVSRRMYIVLFLLLPSLLRWAWLNGIPRLSEFEFGLNLAVRVLMTWVCAGLGLSLVTLNIPTVDNVPFGAPSSFPSPLSSECSGSHRRGDGYVIDGEYECPTATLNSYFWCFYVFSMPLAVARVFAANIGIFRIPAHCRIHRKLPPCKFPCRYRYIVILRLVDVQYLTQ